MPDIREFEELDQLESWILDNYNIILESIVQTTDFPRDELFSLEIEELIIAGEWGRGTPRTAEFSLQIIFVLDVDGEVTSETRVFQTFAESVVNTFSDPEFREQIPGFQEPPLLVQGTFEEIQTVVIASDRFEEGINRFIQIREGEPNRGYSLTRDQDIFVLEGGDIRREQAGIEVDRDIEVTESSNIRDFPEPDDLIERIETAYITGVEQAMEQYPDQAELIQQLTIENIIFIGEWGSGTAEYGVDRFDIVLAVNTVSDQLQRGARIRQTISDIAVNAIQPSDLMKEWSGGVTMRVITAAGIEDFIRGEIEDPAADRAYDILNDVNYELEERETFGFNVVTDIEEPTPEPEPEPELEVEEPEEVPEEVALAEAFPDVPVELLQFIDDEGEVTIPAGKGAKTVEPRPMYDFEMELITPGPAGTGLGTFQEGIGESMASGMFGTGEAPGTFPRTGVYVKNRLFYEGPAYVLEMYRDLVIYTGFIRSIHNVNIRPGRYSAFREFIYRAEQIGQRGGPELIRPLSQQQASGAGLETIPDHPSIPGEKAPWLQNRQYYEIIEDNFDHDAWNNITEYLYEVLGVEEQ